MVMKTLKTFPENEIKTFEGRIGRYPAGKLAKVSYWKISRVTKNRGKWSLYSMNTGLGIKRNFTATITNLTFSITSNSSPH